MGIPQNGGLRRESPIKIDDLGVPPFQETSICMKEYYVQDKLAIVRTDRKLHVENQTGNEATF